MGERARRPDVLLLLFPGDQPGARHVPAAAEQFRQVDVAQPLAVPIVLSAQPLRLEAGRSGQHRHVGANPQPVAADVSPLEELVAEHRAAAKAVEPGGHRRPDRVGAELHVAQPARQALDGVERLHRDASAGGGAETVAAIVIVDEQQIGGRQVATIEDADGVGEPAPVGFAVRHPADGAARAEGARRQRPVDEVVARPNW